jgi:hypothetical protein
MIATERAQTRNSASYRVGALRAGLLAALLVLQGCAGDDPNGGRDSDQAATSAAAAREDDKVAVAEPDAVGFDVAPADAMTAVDLVEAEQATRRVAAQTYLDSAQADARERHRRALEHCHGSVDADFETCVATADQSLEAELRSARVEFDTRMEAD